MDRCRRDSQGAVARRPEHRLDVRRLCGRDGGRRLPWRKLLPDWARPSWGATLTSRFAASGINALLPFFGLGEASRLLWLPRGERSPGLAALVVDRLLFLAAGMPILVVAALAATRVPAVPHGYLLAVLISASVIFVAVPRSPSVPRAAAWSAGCAGR